jgi:hypothetical protein
VLAPNERNERNERKSENLGVFLSFLGVLCREKAQSPQGEAFASLHRSVVLRLRGTIQFNRE